MEEKGPPESGESAREKLRVSVQFETFYAADFEWLLRLVDYAVQSVLLEAIEPTRPTPRGPFRGRIGRFAPELGDVSLLVHSARTGHSLDIVFTLWNELPRVAAGLNTAYLLTKAFRWLRERRGALRGRGLPRLPKLTVEGMTTGRLRIIRITLEVPRRRPESFDYVRDSGYR